MVMRLINRTLRAPGPCSCCLTSVDRFGRECAPRHEPSDDPIVLPPSVTTSPYRHSRLVTTPPRNEPDVFGCVGALSVRSDAAA
jgi:hypothetical protein